MEVVRLQYPFNRQFHEKQVLAIGDFDGVHLGHRSVIGNAVRIARQQDAAVAIMTFDPHPREVLGMQRYECLLTPFPHKLQLLQTLNLDYLYVITFDEAFATVQAEQFIEQVLKKMNLLSVIVGFDFTFGHRGRGTAPFLREYNNKSFDVHIVDAHLQSEEKVSSTRIRRHLEDGAVELIPDLLGRPYDLIGVVQHGDGRGRSIGFPTANLELDGKYILPKHGVYGVYASVDGVSYPAIVNIGVRPTFFTDPAVANVEVHLLDFDGDLYNKTMKIDLIRFIREERKFAGIDQLVEQIKTDIEVVKMFF